MLIDLPRNPHGVLPADNAAETSAINAVIGSLFNPQVRSDSSRMAMLTTADFDGDIDSIPVRTVWCETSCEGFRLRSLKFVTADVALADGETTMGAASMSKWVMILKRDSGGWRISSIRSFAISPLIKGHQFAGN